MYIVGELYSFEVVISETQIGNTVTYLVSSSSIYSVQKIVIFLVIDDGIDFFKQGSLV